MKKQEAIQAYIGKLTRSNPVEVYFVKPKMQVNVEVGNSPVFGGDKAAVTVVEFSDFQCPFCSRGAETVTAIKKKYGSKVKVAFRHFPLPMHKDAKPASEASMCVHEQNADKFWKYHDLLFKNQDKLDGPSLEKYAKEVGADTKKFQECMTAKKYADFVQKDLEYGEKIGVRSTPTFFINGQMVAGAVPIEQISEIVDEELENAKK
jgi:protein-disulfide isomerase